jgi:hypothetical protein
MNRNLLKINVLTRADLPFVVSRRALHVVRNNPDLLFRFLSENVPAFVRSEDGPISEKRKAQPDAVRARDYCICFPKGFPGAEKLQIKKAYVLSFERYLQYIEASISKSF